MKKVYNELLCFGHIEGTTHTGAYRRVEGGGWKEGEGSGKITSGY